jgi:hypothetical protein
MTRFSHRLITFTGALALSLAFACGGDDDGDGDGGTTDDGDDDGMTDDGDDGDDGDDDGDGGGVCPDHPNVEEQDGACIIVDADDTQPIVEDLTLTADVEWVLDGPTFIGDDVDTTVLTVEPGTTVFGGAQSFLVIQRGSQIIAEGTADAPILFTSALAEGDRAPGDWGGLVINGRAPVNLGTDVEGEAGSGFYGGDDPEDSSGILTYVIVEFAGYLQDPKNELNGIAFQAVGSGTTVDFLQANMTSDDGVEFFGGTVSLRHVVVTGADDDSIDWVGGWTGAIQYAVAQQLTESGAEADHGIEADNFEDDPIAEPISEPLLANVTLIGREGQTGPGTLFREGTRGQLHNAIITGFGDFCVTTDDLPETQANITDGSLAVNNLVLNCAGGEFSVEAEGLSTDAVFEVADPLIDPVTWLPTVDSLAIGIGPGPDDPFFDEVDYAGAFAEGDDWASAWISTAVE